MATTSPSPTRIRFDEFEVDLASGEVWKRGTRLRLQEQPFQVLRTLLEHSGEIVSREELKQRLWPADTFVDFDDGLHTAVKKIRDALGDSADRPRYIETIPRRGYRFLAAVKLDPRPAPSPPVEIRPSSTANKRPKIVAAIASVAALTIAVGLWYSRYRVPLVPTRVRAIAVLPLENRSGDPSQDYFASGLTDSLTTELARTMGGSIRVISRTSAEKYRDKPLPQIANELDVDAVIEGSVIRSGTRARINAQLIHARADQHLWAATYDRDLHDMLSLQREIAATIARQVQIKLTPRAEARLAAPAVVNPEAYDLYQRGRYRAFSNNARELAEAIQLLEHAIRIEPNFATAHALLARAYRTQAFLVEPQAFDLEAKASFEVSRALELDPDLAEAYLARGINLWTHRNGFPHQQAIGDIKRALEFDPNLAEAHHELAKIYLHVGLLEEAERELRTAQQLEPTNMGIRYRRAVTLLDQGRPQEAIVGLEGTRAFTPDLWTYQMAFALFQLDRKSEASTIIGNYLRNSPRDEGGVGNAMQALLYADAGEATLAENSIRRAIRQGKDFGHFHHAAYTIGSALAVLNRKQEAMKWLRAAAADGFPCYPLFEKDRSLHNLRDEAEFKTFLLQLDAERKRYGAGR